MQEKWDFRQFVLDCERQDGFQQGREEGREEGIRKGREEGIQKGRIDGEISVLRKIGTCEDDICRFIMNEHNLTQKDALSRLTGSGD